MSAETLAEVEPDLMRIALHLCATQADARDLVQDTFERAMRKGPPSPLHNPRAWLATIMHNLFIDRCRHVRRAPIHESLEPLAEIAHRPCDPDPDWSRITVADIHSALTELEPAYRDVYVLHTFEHWTYERIATRFAIERVTVGTRLTRARKQIREILIARFSLEVAE